jgi:hypothetical protein
VSVAVVGAGRSLCPAALVVAAVASAHERLILVDPAAASAASLAPIDGCYSGSSMAAATNDPLLEQADPGPNARRK